MTSKFIYLLTGGEKETRSCTTKRAELTGQTSTKGPQ